MLISFIPERLHFLLTLLKATFSLNSLILKMYLLRNQQIFWQLA